jgi:hypothetical protein
MEKTLLLKIFFRPGATVLRILKPRLRDWFFISMAGKKKEYLSNTSHISEEMFEKRVVRKIMVPSGDQVRR